MRDLEHLRPQGLAGGEQVALGRGLDVAGQQHRDAGNLEAQHQRAVVGIRAGASVGPAGRQHLPPHAARDPHLAERPPDDRDLPVMEPADHPGVLPRRLIERADLDRADPASAQGTGQAFDVVRVQVRQHDQRQR